MSGVLICIRLPLASYVSDEPVVDSRERVGLRITSVLN